MSVSAFSASESSSGFPDGRVTTSWRKPLDCVRKKRRSFLGALMLAADDAGAMSPAFNDEFTSSRAATALRMRRRFTGSPPRPQPRHKAAHGFSAESAQVLNAE